MKPDLMRGREIAEIATKGEWKWSAKNYYDGMALRRRYLIGPKVNMNFSLETSIGIQCDADYAHIAHHSGQTMIQIYDYITELDTRLGVAQLSSNGWEKDCSERDEIIKAKQARIEELRIIVSSLEAKNKVMEGALTYYSKGCLTHNPMIATDPEDPHSMHRTITDRQTKIAIEALSRVEEMRKEK